MGCKIVLAPRLGFGPLLRLSFLCFLVFLVTLQGISSDQIDKITLGAYGHTCLASREPGQRSSDPPVGSADRCSEALERQQFQLLDLSTPSLVCMVCCAARCVGSLVVPARAPSLCLLVAPVCKSSISN